LIIIGLTGKIGSGKTTTSKIIKELGYEVFDCDECSRNLINSKKVISQIQTEFKESKDIFINHSEINRNLFGNYLFSNPDELLKLEKILHPLIKKKEKEFILENSLKNHDIVFLDIPLLFEKLNFLRCDYVIYTFVNKNIQKQRVLKRPHMNESKFLNILNKQKFNSLKIEKYIDIKINTGSGTHYVRKKLINFLKKIKKGKIKKIWPIQYNYYNSEK
jgi:dephospho-CoA kinase|tara:strand:- start:1364 stop:2017 length:654 start_codon:yes stop_codon:yes gene_type:complete